MKEFTEKTDIVTFYDLRNISPLGEMLLFDIETTGLKKETTQIYLIGCGYFDADGAFTVKQWLTESAQDEREVLEQFAECARRYRVLVHFNGDGFDIPYTSYKLDFYGMDFDLRAMESVDIYKAVKPYKKFLGLARMNQTSLESFLEIERRDRMNGGALIPYYYEYEKTGDSEAERLLLLHNSDDVKGMIQLTAALSWADLFEGRFVLKHAGVVSAHGCISGGGAGADKKVMALEFELKNPVPKASYIENAGLSVYAEGFLLQINIDIYNGEALIPVQNYQDYYYLPEEDRIIHKDVAVYVDKAYRKKATKKNAWLKKQGEYIPSFGLVPERTEVRGSMQGIGSSFMIPGAKGKVQEAIPVEEIPDDNGSFLRALAMRILQSVQ